MLAELIARQRPQLLACLVRRWGLSQLALAEDAVQQACLRALETWPRDGAPERPGGWLLRAAQHWAIDQHRAARRLQPWPDDDPLEADAAALDAAWQRPAASGRLAGELHDDELALLFAACHPALPPATQLLLALRCLSPLDLATLADALFSTEAALAQRLARARQSLAGQTLAVPAGAALPERRASVMAALWLMFGEGMKASGRQGSREAGEAAARALCWEAIRLARALAAHPATAHADADALAALLLLQGARLSGRLDEAGDIIPLPGQARDRWDAGLLRLAMGHLQAAQRAPQLSRYHLMAGMAAEHALAPSYSQTNWGRIARSYQHLLALDPSPAPRLGHAVALAESGEPARAEALLQAWLPQLPDALRPHGLAALARALALQGEQAQACDRLREAIACVRHPADGRMLQRRLDALLAPAGPTAQAPPG